MRNLATYFAIATLALGAPVALAQSSNTMNNAKAAPAAGMPNTPRAGDANTGGSGGGATGNETTATTKNSNCMDVWANPSKYSKDVIANCK